MAEAAKVRLVRCPKCENLLPELPDFSLYQCGGCGAVLKAKKKGILEDEITENVKGEGVPEGGGVVKVSEVDMENINGIEGVKVERLDNDRLALDGSSASLAESREVIADSDTSMREQESHSQGLTHDRNQGKKCDLNVDRPEYVHFHNENVQEGRPPVGSSGLRPVVDQWGLKSNGSAVSRGAAKGRRSDNFRYHDEGQSSYGLNPYHESKERSRYQHDVLDELGRFEELEIGRAELLRKLDELKDQITQSYHVSNQPDPYGKQGVNKKPPALSALNDTGPSYLSQTGGFMPYREGYRSSGPGAYFQRGYPNEFPPYADVYQPEVFRRPPRRSQSQYMHRPYHGRYPGYMDANQDLFMLHPHENIFHQPACSCMHCRDKNCHMPPNIDPSSYHSRRSRNELSNSNVYHNPHPTVRSTNLHPLHSRRGPALNPSVLDSENDGLNHRFPRKLAVAPRNSQVSYPVAGGAPFITCSNCFELLKLPQRHISSKMSQKKMRCGACSSVILFELGDDGLITSVSPNVDQAATEADQGSSGTLDGNMGYWNNGSNDDNMNSCSNDYDDFPEFSPTDKRSNTELSEKHLDPLSSSSLSEDEQSSEHSISRKHGSEGQRSKRSEQERVPLDKNSSRQNSLRDVAVATEIDVPLNEFANSCVSQYSVDSNKDHTKVNKGGDSFFAGLIKKSLRDLIKSNHEACGSQVSVNGHFIPDRMIKKAEKLAGPIQPGEYWYDKRAGFWGVIGHPCMGIIMPNIEEFDYPMSPHCAAGNTRVFVNGRELHQKDLDLLATRGLPITKNKSYLIDITGKVVDEHTGEELDGLGKLAPTVEKAKHGFGMKVPQFVSRLQG